MAKRKLKRKWMQGAVPESHRGLFTEKAHRAGFPTAQAYASHVKAHKDQYNTTTLREANFAQRGAHISRAHSRKLKRRK